MSEIFVSFFFLPSLCQKEWTPYLPHHSAWLCSSCQMTAGRGLWVVFPTRPGAPGHRRPGLTALCISGFWPRALHRLEAQSLHVG